MENPINKDSERTVRYIGCCCSYCKTCREFTNGNCRGCKLGYDSGDRDINRAKCKIKVCCFKERKFETCADCPDYLSCKLIQYRFKGYQLKKCLQLIEFIRENGYAGFMKTASRWKDCFGKLE